MFDFVRKPELWDALDLGWRARLGDKRPFHLKTIQDLAVFRLIKDCADVDIAEIGGGDSRVLKTLARANRCVNVEKFEGADGGPKREVKIRGVRNVRAFLGEFDERLAADSFDVVFSVSVVEHVPVDGLENFLKDGLRILRKGGLWLHAIDMYVDESAAPSARYDAYRRWSAIEGVLAPVGPVFDGPARFSPDMASNPDNIMYEWGKIAPSLIERRQRMQSVSLVTAARKL